MYYYSHMAKNYARIEGTGHWGNNVSTPLVDSFIVSTPNLLTSSRHTTAVSVSVAAIVSIQPSIVLKLTSC